MEITETRVRLLGRAADRLKAFCSITFDNAFVVRDLKVIEGSNGIFVAMPSRKITDHCPKCRGKNTMLSRFCCECGCKLDSGRGPRDLNGRIQVFADICHPINTQCRDMIQNKVLQAYKDEVERAKKPGYKPGDFKEHPSELQDEQKAI
ncbi:MAG: septation protein SpoVG family protein [Planctomycetes bacterium]|nr:septation protein SpoVG family protein [Planctomycetota bacterium]